MTSRILHGILNAMKGTTFPNIKIDISLPSQLFRHNYASKITRKLIYYLTVGREGYPFIFRQFINGEKLAHYKSENLYIHIPFCRTICTHCPYNKIIFNNVSYKSFRIALDKELKYYLKQKGIPQIKTLYFGGGTPSMSPETINHVIKLSKSKFAKIVEVGVEIHPRDATVEILQQLKDYGVNRISLAIETFRDDILKKLGRTYDGNRAELAIKNAQKVKFECIDVNIIYGIPGQEIQGSIDDVKHCIELGVDHLSAYPLITFEHTYLGKLVREGKFKEYNDRKRLKTQKAIAQTCISNGFKRTSVWSFTKKNSSAYTTVTRENYIGFGPGAGSKVNGEFWFNTFSVNEYNKLDKPKPAIILKTTEKFRRLHWLYWQIYSTKIDINKYKKLFNRDISNDYKVLIFFGKMFGWLKKEGSILTFSEKGSLWSHKFQMLFSLTFIDEVWTECQKTPWPNQITLY